jgi:anaerobic dimethyl sulfoxide reductase subunit C (anchor subunit)
LLAATGFARLTTTQGKETRKVALVSALVLFAVGGLMSVLHLAHPERFMAAIANLLSFSGISLELIGLAFSGVVTMLFLAFAAAENQVVEKAIAVCSIVIGVVAAFFHGYAYFEVAAQQGWHTIALAFSYMLTSLTAGFLIYAALTAWKADDEAGRLLVVKTAIVLAALATVAIIIYIVSLGVAGLLLNEAVILAALAIVFEAAALILTIRFISKNPSVKLAAGGALLGICGGLTVRVLMWVVSSYGLSMIWEAAANRGLYLFQ